MTEYIGWKNDNVYRALEMICNRKCGLTFKDCPAGLNMYSKKCHFNFEAECIDELVDDVQEQVNHINGKIAETLSKIRRSKC